MSHYARGSHAVISLERQHTASQMPLHHYAEPPNSADENQLPGSSVTSLGNVYHQYWHCTYCLATSQVVCLSNNFKNTGHTVIHPHQITRHTPPLNEHTFTTTEHRLIEQTF